MRIGRSFLHHTAPRAQPAPSAVLLNNSRVILIMIIFFLLLTVALVYGFDRLFHDTGILEKEDGANVGGASRLEGPWPPLKKQPQCTSDEECPNESRCTTQGICTPILHRLPTSSNKTQKQDHL